MCQNSPPPLSGTVNEDRNDDSGIVLESEASLCIPISPEIQIPVPEPVIFTLPLLEHQTLILDSIKILPFENKALLCQGNLNSQTS